MSSASLRVARTPAVRWVGVTSPIGPFTAPPNTHTTLDWNGNCGMEWGQGGLETEQIPVDGVAYSGNDLCHSHQVRPTGFLV